MARYIDLDKVEFLKVEDNKEFNHGVDCCINSLLKIEPVNVVERSKIDNAIKEIKNLKMYGHEQDYYDCKYEVLEILKRHLGE